MSGRKKIRTRGKLKLSRYFQKLEKGERVSVVRENSMQASFPARLQGRTGLIENKRGKSYLVKIKDQAKEKSFLIDPIHLKKIKYFKSDKEQQK